MRLREQAGEAHYLPLARKLFDEAKIFHSEASRYEEATRYAARFWFEFVTYIDGLDEPMQAKRLRSALKDLYWQSWQGKIRQFETQSFLKVS